MENKNNIPPTEKEIEHKEPCADCPHKEKTDEEALTVNLDLNDEIKKIKEDISAEIKAQFKEVIKELKESATTTVKEALKTKLVIGNLKAPEIKTKQEDKNEYLELLKTFR